MLRVTLRISVLGQHCSFIVQTSQSSLLDRYLISLLLVMPVRGFLKLRRKRLSSLPLGQV